MKVPKCLLSAVSLLGAYGSQPGPGHTLSSKVDGGRPSASRLGKVDSGPFSEGRPGCWVGMGLGLKGRLGYCRHLGEKRCTFQGMTFKFAATCELVVDIQY